MHRQMNQGSETETAPARGRRPHVGRWLFAAAVVVALAAVAAVPRAERARTLDRLEAAARAPRRVSVAVASPAPATVEFSLPGTALPMVSTALRARTTGFVRRLHVDMGDRVRAGQLLAELDAPETLQELRVAQARLSEAEKNVGLAQGTAERHARLATEGISTRQQADDARARANSASASLSTSRAELQRLAALRVYLRITAPFDGVITRRHVDTGALVTPGAEPLFELAQTEMLKVYVDVPQTFAPMVKVGQSVNVAPRAMGTTQVAGKVARTAGALDPSARTLRTEVHLPAHQTLLAGSFVTVTFAAERTGPAAVMIPASTLVLRKEGPRVATIVDGKAKFLPVQIAWDRGRQVELAGGLRGNETLVVNPPDNLEDGEPLQAAEAPARAK